MGDTVQELLRRSFGRCKAQLELLASFASSNHPEAVSILENVAHRGIMADEYDHIPWEFGNVDAVLKGLYPIASQDLRARHRFAMDTLRVCEFQGSWLVVGWHVKKPYLERLSESERLGLYNQFLPASGASFKDERADAMSALEEYLSAPQRDALA